MKINTKDKRVFVIADIHGEFSKLETLYNTIVADAGFNPGLDMLIQLGDRNDRGKETYKVNEWWKSMMETYPENVFCLNGNHDDMLIGACHGTSDLMYYNGGNQTLESYSKQTHQYGKNSLWYSMKSTGHYDWTRSLPYYIESDEYFFSHAPISLEKYRESPIGVDPRNDHHGLTWTFVDGVDIKDWIDPNPILKEYGNESKICVYGHIHSGYYNSLNKEYNTPNPRKFTNAVLLDTGSGCWQGAALTCLQLPDMLWYDSVGQKGKIE